MKLPILADIHSIPERDTSYIDPCGHLHDDWSPAVESRFRLVIEGSKMNYDANEDLDYANFIMLLVNYDRCYFVVKAFTSRSNLKQQQSNVFMLVLGNSLEIC